MRLATAFFLIITGAASAQDKPALSWMTDLDAACKKADRQGKMIFYREVTCSCDAPAKCPYTGIALRPGFLDDKEARARLAEKFVLVTCRRPKDVALVDLAEDPGESMERPIRSYFLTPTLHVVHTLDGCSLSGDIESEIDFVLLLRLMCFGKLWETDEDSAKILKSYRSDHRISPRQFHLRKETGRPAVECGCKPVDSGSPSRRPWSGYASGIPWHTDFDEARLLAEHTKRPLLYWQVVGDLDKEGC